ncbi:MAG TPA: energy transducer TonB [Acidobacteriaceae bacterium]|nr:energy transducer TonB [Acidobacteriaceae bacterium]
MRTDNALREDMTSMVRAILYQERDGLPRLELLELLVVSMGGYGIGAAADQVHEPVRQVLAFVDEVIRSRRDQRGGRVEGGKVEGREVEGLGPEMTEQSAASHLQRQGDEPAGSVGGDLDAAGLRMGRVDMQATVLEAGSLKVRPCPDEAISGAEATLRDDADPEEPEDERVYETPGSRRGGDQPPLLLPPVPRNRLFFAFACCALTVAISAGWFVGHWLILENAHGRADSHVAGSGAATEPMLQGASAAVAPPVEAGSAAPSGAAVSAGGVEPAGSRSAASEGGVGAETGTSPGASETSRGAAAADSSAPARSGWPRVPSESLRVDTDYAPASSLAVSSAKMERRLIYAPTPSYPKLAHLAHIQGQVVLQAVIGGDGRVRAAHALSGPRLLRGAATKAVRSRRYLPYTVNGRRADVAAIVAVDFKLPQRGGTAKGR